MSALRNNSASKDDKKEEEKEKDKPEDSKPTPKYSADYLSTLGRVQLRKLAKEEGLQRSGDVDTLRERLGAIAGPASPTTDSEQDTASDTATTTATAMDSFPSTDRKSVV